MPSDLPVEGTQKYRIAKLAEKHTLDELIAAAEKRAYEDQDTDFTGTLRKLNLKIKRRKSAKSGGDSGSQSKSP